MIYLGIDPGLSGAVAFIFPCGTAKVFDMPVETRGSGKGRVKNQVSGIMLSYIVHEATGEEDVMCFLESVNSMPGQGVASVFSLGDSFGLARGVLNTFFDDVQLIRPQAWKGHFDLIGKDVDKDASRLKAIDLFPDAPLGRKKDHGRAEALLIAAYGKYLVSDGRIDDIRAEGL